MAFFDDLGKKITDTVDVVGKKTNEVVEVQKLRSQISGLERDIEKRYVELGKRTFERYQEHDQLADEEVAICEEIAGNMVLIEEYNNEITEIKGLKKCPDCGAPTKPDMNFCPKCGAKLEFPEEKDCDCGDAEEKDSENCGCEDAAEETAPEDKCCCGSAEEKEAE